MSIVAIVPASSAQAANDAIVAADPKHGPNNFFVLTWDNSNSSLPAFIGLHAWGGSDLIAAIKAQPDVIWEDDQTGTPPERFRALVAGQNATWGGDAVDMPESGTVQPGLYRYGNEMRRVIQAIDRDTYGGDPAQYQSLCRIARDPRRVLPWRQPIDGFDAYRKDTPWGPERVTHNGDTWEVTDADDGGNNVWVPGQFGWSKV